MKARVMLVGFVLAASFCALGCGGSGVIATAVSKPPAAANVAFYMGCRVFTPGDSYNQPVTNAPVDPNSANYIAAIASVDRGGFYLSTGAEWVNLADSSTHTYAIKPKVSYFPGWAANPPWPWNATFKIEPAPSDQHAIVLRTNDCRLFETYDTTFSAPSGPLSAFSGWSWDLKKPFVPVWTVVGSHPSAMASGLSLFAGAVKSEELQAGVINHALDWGAVAHSVAQSLWTTPGSSTDGLPYTGSMPTYQLPYGAHLRLKSSFDDSAFGPQSRMITRALKVYGMYLADTGCCDALYGIEGQSGSVWNRADLASLSQLRITDFEVITLSAIHHT